MCAGVRYSRHRHSFLASAIMVCHHFQCFEDSLAAICQSMLVPNGQPAVLTPCVRRVQQSSAWQTMGGGGALWTSLSRRPWRLKVGLMLKYNPIAAALTGAVCLDVVKRKARTLCNTLDVRCGLADQGTFPMGRGLDRWSCRRRSSAMCQSWPRWTRFSTFSPTDKPTQQHLIEDGMWPQ